MGTAHNPTEQHTSANDHRARAAYLRERAAHFKAQGGDEELSYAADLECEADEIDAECNRGPVDA